MRLTDTEKQAIIDVILTHLSSHAKIWLFGSRVGDKAKGGDIDLFIETPPLENAFQRKIQCRIALSDKIGEQKIDLLVHESHLAPEPIHIHAKKSGLRLNPSE